MNHKEITKKWYGKNCEENKELGPQCVAWAKKYCEERGYPINSFLGSAIMGWYSANPFDSSWVRVNSTGLNYPSEGDIIFWSDKRCENGHVAVANGFCNPFLLRYSDQNGTGHGDVIQPRWSSLKNVLGWYHKTQKYLKIRD